MLAVQVPPQQPTVNAVDAIWSLVQCQTKSVQRALAKRFIALEAERKEFRKANTISPDLQSRLDASRKDIQEGKGTICRNKAELQSFLAAL